MKSRLCKCHGLISVLIALCGFADIAEAQTKTTCANSTTSVAFFYCITEAEGSQSADVIYYLHGGLYEAPTGSAWSSSERFAAVRDHWARGGAPAPRVVEISFGRIWLLTPQNASARSGLIDVFTNLAIPYTDSKLSNPQVGSRILLGHSMGGLNASLLANFKSHVFARAALLAPAFFGVSPYASDEEIQAYALRQGFSVESMMGLIATARAFVPDESTWWTLAPDTVAQNLAERQFPLYISSGTEDRLFFGPSQAFAERVQFYGGNIIWKPLMGGNHSDLDVDSLAKFLVP